MSTNEKLLFVWILVTVVAGYLFHHFWGCAFCALENMVAFHFASLPGLAKIAGAWFSIQCLP